MAINEYRVRVIFKDNNPMVDGAGGFYDIYTDSTLDSVAYPGEDVTECWAKIIKQGPANRGVDANQTAQERVYRLEIRTPPDYQPGKNTLLEIVGFTNTDATVQGWEWDPFNKVMTITATERL